MSHGDEYTDAMLAAMDLIWGEGLMAPGGAGNVEQMVRGIDLDGRVLSPSRRAPARVSPGRGRGAARCGRRAV